MRSAACARWALAACAASFLVHADAAERKERADPALEIGSVPHDELGKDIDGNAVTISEHRGKVVIVSFWASWCGPCRKELPVLAGVAKKVGPEHLKLIAINYQDQLRPFNQVAAVLKTLPITVLRDSNNKAARKYQVRGIPRMIIIDRSGKVAADHTGYGEDMVPDLVDELNRLLAQTT
jgi:thiol-disulfide isomerase/thioredoxin